MRRLIAFPCNGAMLVGTLDDAPGTTGLLVVSGGNEIRAGSHRGMAMLAARVADAGHPVFRFDRRGIGDSEGGNGGWAASQPDLAAAAQAFRREQPQLRRVVAMGNCDAATALACFAATLPLDALILTNPWTGDDADGLPPPAAIRQRYRRRLLDPRIWWRLLTGDVDFPRLLSGLRKSLAKPSQSVANRMAAGLCDASAPVTILLAAGDATALGFRARWHDGAFTPLRRRATLVEIATASHSFQHQADAAALGAAVLAALR